MLAIEQGPIPRQQPARRSQEENKPGDPNPPPGGPIQLPAGPPAPRAPSGARAPGARAPSGGRRPHQRTHSLPKNTLTTVK